jgi:hypothetical protein
MLSFLRPRSPNSMLHLCHGELPKSCFDAVYDIELGERGWRSLVVNVYLNFAVLSGMILDHVQDCS